MAPNDMGSPHGPDRDEALPVLPREDASWFGPIGQTQRPAMSGPSEPTRILLVEGDALHRRIVRVVLANPRIALIEVTTGEAALDLLAIKRFDLVILGGLNPSYMTRTETVQWIRRSLQPWADIAILALLEPGEAAGAGRLVADGATDWSRYQVKREEFVEKLISLMPMLSGVGL